MTSNNEFLRDLYERYPDLLEDVRNLELPEGEAFPFSFWVHLGDVGCKYIRADLAAERERELVDAAYELLNHAYGDYEADDGNRAYLIHSDFLIPLAVVIRHKERS